MFQKTSPLDLRSFFALCHLNRVFGSLAMAAMGTFQWFPVFQVLLGWAAAVVGLRIFDP